MLRFAAFLFSSRGRCYGCAAAATEHCVTLLRALATNAETRQILVKQVSLVQGFRLWACKTGHVIAKANACGCAAANTEHWQLTPRLDKYLLNM